MVSQDNVDRWTRDLRLPLRLRLTEEGVVTTTSTTPAACAGVTAVMVESAVMSLDVTVMVSSAVVFAPTWKASAVASVMTSRRFGAVMGLLGGHSAGGDRVKARSVLHALGRAYPQFPHASLHAAV